MTFFFAIATVMFTCSAIASAMPSQEHLSPNEFAKSWGDVSVGLLATAAESTGQEGSPQLWKAWGQQIKVAWSGNAAADSADIRRFATAMLGKSGNPTGDWRPGLHAAWKWICLPQLNDADYAALLVTWVQKRGYWEANDRGRVAVLTPQQTSTIHTLIGLPQAWRTARHSGLGVLAFEGDPWVKSWIVSARAAIDADEPSASADERRVLIPGIKKELDYLDEIASVANSPTQLLQAAQTLNGVLSIDAMGRWAINRSIALGTSRATVSSELKKWLGDSWAKANGDQQAVIIRQKLICIEEGWILASDLPEIPSVSLDPPRCGP